MNSLLFDDAEIFAYAMEMILNKEHLSHNQDVGLFLGDAIYYLREINKRFNLNQISSTEYLLLIHATKDFKEGGKKVRTISSCILNNILV